MVLYPWVVIAHVVFVILSFGAHGVSAFAMFRVKRETDRARIGAVLDLSTTALVAAGIGLILAVVLGIIAAAMAGYFGRLWPWASIAVVVVVWIAMTPMAAGPMSQVRHALGLPSRIDKKGDPPPQPGTDVELAAAQAKLRPEAVAGLGIVAIVVLVWLMEAKPF
jgi:uncharacterized membrane protein SirB2